MKEIRTIGIIGGTHGLGKRLAEFFAQKFSDRKRVLVSGRSTRLTNLDLVEQSDLVIFAVPISITKEVIASCVSQARADQIWMDITSVKTGAVAAMCASKAEVCGMHPVFGPMPKIKGETVFYCPERISDESLKAVLALFEDFELIRSTPQEHDDLMGIVQCVSHFSDLVMGDTLRESGLDFVDILAASSPAYRLKLEVMGRMFSQNSRLYAEIATENPASVKFTNLFLKRVEWFQSLIEKKDRATIEAEFSKISGFLGKEFCETSWKDSQQFLTRLKKGSDFNPPGLDQISDVAVFGQAFSHTDSATHDFLPKLNHDYGLKNPSFGYYENVFEVFEAIDAGKARFGVLPYENSREGSIFETLDELFDYKNISVLALQERSISQCLLGLPNAQKSEITRVHSHRQALAQSKQFLRKHFAAATIINEPSTAMAAQKIIELEDPSRAAIGSPELAEALGLIVLEKDIQGEDNRTRFVLVGKELPREKNKYTSLVFWFPKDDPGNLAKVLTFFSENNINLVKLDPRRAEKKYGSYLFFVDLKISLQDFGALKPLLASMTGGVKVLGTWGDRIL